MAEVRLILILYSAARIGPGRPALLESIQSTSAISAAARLERAWKKKPDDGCRNYNNPVRRLHRNDMKLLLECSQQFAR